MKQGVAFSIGTIDVHWYGIIIGAAILLGLLILAYYCKKYGYDKELPIDLALWAVPLAVIGARVYYVIFSLDMYLKSDTPFLDMIKISDGGLAIYGAVIGGIIGAWIYSKVGFYDGLFNKTKRKQFSFWKIMDLVVPCLVLGQAMGRWGNFFNKEAFGAVVTDKALQWFPMAVNIDIPHQLDGVACAAPWHYATFFYESMWCFIVFAFLLYFRNKLQKAEGEVVFWYFLLYGVERMLVEGLRADSLYIGNTGIRVSQLLSALMVIAGIVFIYLLRSGKLKLGDDRKAKLKTAEAEPEIEQEKITEDIEE